MQNLIQVIQEKINLVANTGEDQVITIPFNNDSILISIKKVTIIDAKISYPKLTYKEVD